MQRRDFLKLSGVCAAALVLGAPERLRAAFPGTNTYPKMVSTILLDGGPDFRFLFVPKPEATGWSGSYAEAFWEARRDLYDTDSIAGYDNLTTDLERATAIYGANYEDVTLSGETFGILNYTQDAVNFDCTWLKAQITAGNVAIISNVVGSTNRDHHHSMMMLESGDMTTGPHDAGVSGWVGRAASALGEKAISLSRNVRMICNGPHPTDPKNHENSCVISAPDTRNTSLYDHETAALMAANDESYMWDQSRIMGRALESYYAAKNASVAATSPYRRFFDHEQSIRSFGAQVNSVLADVTSPAILDYHTGGNLDYIGSDMSKNTDSDYFARQISGLYDAMACRNVLQMRFASLEYPGWDSHKWQQEFVGPKLAYLFGSGKTLDSWYTQTELAASGSTNGMVFVIAGEFGRQLRANGSNGTDHGRGNSVILIGKDVTGGIYGAMFPASENTVDPELNNNKPLAVANTDIEGLTSMRHVFHRVLEWQSTGLGDTVFGDISGEILETDLSGLLA